MRINFSISYEIIVSFFLCEILSRRTVSLSNIWSTDLHGELRSKFFDLLIAMHLESHSKLKLETQNEIVVPLHCSNRLSEKNFQKSHKHSKDFEFISAIEDIDFDFHKIPSQVESSSIYPNLITDDVTLR